MADQTREAIEQRIAADNRRAAHYKGDEASHLASIAASLCRIADTLERIDKTFTNVNPWVPK